MNVSELYSSVCNACDHEYAIGVIKSTEPQAVRYCPNCGSRAVLWSAETTFLREWQHQEMTATKAQAEKDVYKTMTYTQTYGSLPLTFKGKSLSSIVVDDLEEAELRIIADAGLSLL